MLSEEPAGRISIRNAGAISFGAELSWDPGADAPSGPILGEPVPGARFYSFARSGDASSATWRVSCEVRALYAEHLAGALDAILRSVTTHATLAEAVLETRAVRLAYPKVAPVALVEKLARQLWDAGFPVSFGPSWAPAPDADLSVGVRGLEEAFEAFLLMHPDWQTLSQHR